MIERAEDEQKGWETIKSEAQKNMAELNFSEILNNMLKHVETS